MARVNEPPAISRSRNTRSRWRPLPPLSLRVSLPIAGAPGVKWTYWRRRHPLLGRLIARGTARSFTTLRGAHRRSMGRANRMGRRQRWRPTPPPVAIAPPISCASGSGAGRASGRPPDVPAKWLEQRPARRRRRGPSLLTALVSPDARGRREDDHRGGWAAIGCSSCRRAPVVAMTCATTGSGLEQRRVADTAARTCATGGDVASPDRGLRPSHES